MSYRFVIKEQAIYKLQDVVLYYEQKRENLGLTFFEECEYIFNLITHAPELFNLKYRNTREALVKGFPYLILFEIEGDCVIVYAVFHTSQNPKKKSKK